MDFIFVALVVLLPAGVAIYRLANGYRFRTLGWSIIAAGLGQILLPAIVFGLFAGGVPVPTEGRYLAGFFEVSITAVISCVVMWVLLIILAIRCRVVTAPDAAM